MSRQLLSGLHRWMPALESYCPTEGLMLVRHGDRKVRWPGVGEKLPNSGSTGLTQEQEGSEDAWGPPALWLNLCWEDGCLGETHSRPNGPGENEDEPDGSAD